MEVEPPHKMLVHYLHCGVYAFIYIVMWLGNLSKTFKRNSSVKGGGYPPFPLRKKTFFFSDGFSVKAGGGVPP